ncbi:MAG: hypothetical protein J6Y29_02505, partial [Clostridiales bacterium]|nr:hypothetical protein [Clostridiales bacterium]
NVPGVYGEVAYASILKKGIKKEPSKSSINIINALLLPFRHRYAPPPVVVLLQQNYILSCKHLSFHLL